MISGNSSGSNLPHLVPTPGNDSVPGTDSTRVDHPLAPNPGSGSTRTDNPLFRGIASSIVSALRQIPNPAHVLLSAPGRALTVLTLASRGISGMTVPTTDNTRMSTAAAPLTALPDIPQSPPEPAWMAAMDDQSRDVVLSREKRAPRGAARGGGGRSSSRGSSRGGSRSRGGSWGSSRGRGGSRGVTIGGRPATATGKYVKVGSKTYKEYTTSKTSYYTGKKWYNVHGQRVDLHKRLMYTESGKLKGHITTSKGAQYKITRSGDWLKIRTNNQLTISTLPQVTLRTIAGITFRTAVLNLYLNHLMHIPVELHFLFHNGEPYKLSCVPNPEDDTKVDIGYYDDNAVQLPTVSTNATAVSTADNSTTAPGSASSNTTALDLPGNNTHTTANSGKKFVRLASAPKGSSISFAVLNNQNPKAKTTAAPASAGANITTPSDAQTASTTTPTTVSTPTTPANSSAVVPYNTTDIEDSNNITRIDTLIGQEGVATSALSQLVIMNGDEVLKIVPLKQRVSKFLIESGNDTIMAYSMNGPKTIESRHVLLWSWVSNAFKNAGSLLLPALTTAAALKGSSL